MSVKSNVITFFHVCSVCSHPTVRSVKHNKIETLKMECQTEFHGILSKENNEVINATCVVLE